jgi:hypothetical protein
MACAAPPLPCICSEVIRFSFEFDQPAVEELSAVLLYLADDETPLGKATQLLFAYEPNRYYLLTLKVESCHQLRSCKDNLINFTGFFCRCVRTTENGKEDRCAHILIRVPRIDRFRLKMRKPLAKNAMQITCIDNLFHLLNVIAFVSESSPAPNETHEKINTPLSSTDKLQLLTTSPALVLRKIHTYTTEIEHLKRYRIYRCDDKYFSLLGDIVDNIEEFNIPCIEKSFGVNLVDRELFAWVKPMTLADYAIETFGYTAPIYFTLPESRRNAKLVHERRDDELESRCEPDWGGNDNVRKTKPMRRKDKRKW